MHINSKLIKFSECRSQCLLRQRRTIQSSLTKRWVNAVTRSDETLTKRKPMVLLLIEDVPSVALRGCHMQHSSWGTYMGQSGKGQRIKLWLLYHYLHWLLVTKHCSSHSPKHVWQHMFSLDHPNIVCNSIVPVQTIRWWLLNGPAVVPCTFLIIKPNQTFYNNHHKELFLSFHLIHSHDPLIYLKGRHSSLTSDHTHCNCNNWAFEARNSCVQWLLHFIVISTIRLIIIQSFNRSADEGQTVFFTCLKCKFKESENS